MQAVTDEVQARIKAASSQLMQLSDSGNNSHAKSDKTNRIDNASAGNLRVSAGQDCQSWLWSNSSGNWDAFQYSFTKWCYVSSESPRAEGLDQPGTEYVPGDSAFGRATESPISHVDWDCVDWGPNPAVSSIRRICIVRYGL